MGNFLNRMRVNKMLAKISKIASFVLSNRGFLAFSSYRGNCRLLFSQFVYLPSMMAVDGRGQN